MHDSRGAQLKVGDRVFIEAEIVNLATGGDENSCVVDVQIITPDQIDREKVMSPPKVSCLSTKMLTKIGAALVLLLAFAVTASAQETVASRLDRLEATNASILSSLSRQASDINDIRADVKLLNDKIDALAKATMGGTFKASTQDVWGRGAPAQFVGGIQVTPAAPAMMYQAPMMGGYGSGMSAGRSGLLGRLFGKCKRGG